MDISTVHNHSVRANMIQDIIGGNADLCGEMEEKRNRKGNNFAHTVADRISTNNKPGSAVPFPALGMC